MKDEYAQIVHLVGLIEVILLGEHPTVIARALTTVAGRMIATISPDRATVAEGCDAMACDLKGFALKKWDADKAMRDLNTTGPAN